MQFKSRTVALLVVVAMIGSSLLTVGVIRTDWGQRLLPMEEKQAVALPSQGQATPPEVLDKIAQAYELLKESYVSKVDDTKLATGAINGMLSALDDPYTVYFDPTAAKEFQSSLESSFEGIGAEVNMQNNRVTIISPIKGSPAEKAGLRPNDQIISVNGESLDGLSLYEAVGKIRGPKGTQAKLQVVRPGNDQALDVVVVRDTIPLETVKSEKIGQFGKIDITQFSVDTAKNFKEQLNKLEEQNIKGLVIDVRDDPGGLLETVISILEEMIPNQKTILQIEDRNGKRKKIISDLKAAKPYPIVVLINGGSASASEILAGAMSEAGGYKLIGEKSFGKGTVQNTQPLGEDGSNIKMTIAKWLTPNGNWIHKKGITPNLVVKQPEYFHAARLSKKEVLVKDMNSPDVKNLQIMLSGLGLNPGRTDGYFDGNTDAAVKAFEKSHSMTEDGKVDAKTAEAIEEAVYQLIRDPKNDLQLQSALKELEKSVR